MKSILLPVLLCFCLAGAVVTHDPASAATFTSHPSGKSLVMTGEIVAGDDARFMAAVKRSNDRGIRVERMFMNSPGGHVRAGLMLARAFRTVGDIDAVVGRTDRCISMCIVVFAAGHKQVAFRTSKLGIHSVGSVSGSGRQMQVDEDAEDRELTVLISRLLTQWGVPAAVIGKMVTTPMTETAWIHASDWPTIQVLD